MNSSSAKTHRVAVVGGGASGLSAAFHLAEAKRSGAPVEEYLFEASPRLGGAMRTEIVEGCLVEAGADSFLTEKREALDFCRKLGIGNHVIGSEDHQRKTWIVLDGDLVPMPDGLEFIVPAQILPLAFSPLFSWPDKFQVLSEPFQMHSPLEEDESVAAFVERHFGRRLVEVLVDPMLNGIYGADTRQLSVRAVLPRLVQMEQQWGSLLLGMVDARRRRMAVASNSRSRQSIFSALQGGFRELVETVKGKFASERVFLNQPVQAVEPLGSGYRLRFEGRNPMEFDSVVLALPAWQSGGLIRDFDQTLAGNLGEIPYASSLIVALVYNKEDLAELPPGFGVLVPRREGRRLRALTFVGQKFSHRVPDDKILLRCFLGGASDEEILALSDAEVVELVRRELGMILGPRVSQAEPAGYRVFRWERAMAQYSVGHLDRVEAIQSRLKAHSGLFLAGNAYGGFGIPDCLRSGREAAEDCLQ